MNNQEQFAGFVHGLTPEETDLPAVGGMLLHLLGSERWRVRCNPDGYSYLTPSNCKHRYKFEPVLTLGRACVGAARALGWLADD